MRTNQFDKFLTNEDRLHVAICNYLDVQFPDLVYFHPHNEGRRTKFEQFKAKKLRMKPGIPDLLIFSPKGIDHKTCPGLALELKIKPNVVSAYQKKWLKDLDLMGWGCYIIYDFDTAKKVIDSYLI